MSTSGMSIDSGVFIASDNILGIVFDTQITGFSQGGDGGQFVGGTWTPLASVPEPASAVQAGIASAIGLALAAFRKRKEPRRQRPVGPLDASQ